MSNGSWEETRFILFRGPFIILIGYGGNLVCMRLANSDYVVWWLKGVFVTAARGYAGVIRRVGWFIITTRSCFDERDSVLLSAIAALLEEW